MTRDHQLTAKLFDLGDSLHCLCQNTAVVVNHDINGSGQLPQLVFGQLPDLLIELSPADLLDHVLEVEKRTDNRA